MTINRDEFKTQYLAFLRDIEMLAVKLERSDFRIYRPFNESRLRFMNWCTDYENDIRHKIQTVSEYFNILAHECLEYFDMEVYFGTLGSPLEFNDFVSSFTEDELETVYWQIQHGRVGIQEYVLPELDDLIVRCHQLDLLGKREDTFESCERTVFGD